MFIVVRVLVTALALLVAAYLVPGIIVDSLYIAIIAAIILGLLNLIAKPVLIILTLPINILTLGLFTFIINAAIFWFVASFVGGFSVEGFIPALIGSIIVSVASAVGSKFLK